MPENWSLSETVFNPKRLPAQESIFTIGNGSFCTRGTFEESYPGETPATLANGLYDDLPTYQSELVNLPNWLWLQAWLDGEPFRMDRGSLLSYERTLDIFSAKLVRRVLWRSSNQHTLEMQWERWISLADPHAMGIRFSLRSLDYQGPLEVRAGLDGSVDNQGIRHWDLVSAGKAGSDAGFLHLRTHSTHLEGCQAFSLSLQSGEILEYKPEEFTWAPRVSLITKIAPGQSLVFDKLVSTFTSLDSGESGEDLLAVTISHLHHMEGQGFNRLEEASAAAWAREWDDCAITIDGDPQAELNVRFSLYQLLIASPHHLPYGTISARGLSGFGYHGHIFWDAEVYMLPFFIFTRPELARRMLLYRYHTLPGARVKARENGWQGAMFAWESAATGDETTPRWVPEPNGVQLERIWSGEQALFTTAGIAWAVDRYWQITGDDSFVEEYGAELVLDTARFWENRVEWNFQANCYELTNVIGPDEFHFHVNNNAFTNHLVRHHLDIAGKIWDWLTLNSPGKASELQALLGITPERLQAWQKISQNFAFPIDRKAGLIEQFEGYLQLEDINLADYEPRLQSIQVILGLKKSQQVKITRQPDVLLLLYLFKDLLDQEKFLSHWTYYAPRTDLTHGSTLGYSIHAALTAQLGDVESAYHLFQAATQVDLKDTFANTKNGIHTGNAGGIWQAIVMGFAGLDLADGTNINLHPCLPRQWKKLSFSIYLHGKRQRIEIPNANALPDQSVPNLAPLPVNLIDSNPGLFPHTGTEILIDSLPGMAYRGLIDPHRTMLQVDSYCYNLTGVHPSQLIQNQLYGDLIHPHDRDGVLLELFHAQTERSSFSLVYRLISADRKEKWVWEQGHFLPQSENSLQNLIEGRIIELTGRNTAYAALSEYAERLESLREIDQAILAARSSLDVIQIALRALRRLVPADHISLVLFDPPAVQIEVFGFTDRNLEISKKTIPLTPLLRRWWNSRIYDLGPDQVLTRQELLEPYQNPALEEVGGFLSGYNQLVRLESQDALLGILLFSADQAEILARSSLGMVNEIASSLAIAITQRRLWEQLHQANQNLQNLSRRLVDVQEQERRALARELHDEIGQALTAIKINLESMARIPALSDQKRLVDNIEVVSQTLQQVRNLSLDLRPAMLDELGLAATLRWYIDRLAQWNNIDAQFQATLLQERLPIEVETTLFRVAQEALTNTIRHADARRVVVLLSQTHDSILLQVRDNGRGFSVADVFDTAQQGKSMGLLSIQERLHLIGGQLEIHSMPGMGSELLAQIPYIAGLEETE